MKGKQRSVSDAAHIRFHVTSSVIGIVICECDYPTMIMMRITVIFNCLQFRHLPPTDIIQQSRINGCARSSPPCVCWALAHGSARYTFRATASRFPPCALVARADVDAKFGRKKALQHSNM